MGMNLCHYIDTHQSLLQPTPLQGGELPFAVACVGNPKFQPISHLRGQPEKAQLFIWYMAILIHIPLQG